MPQALPVALICMSAALLFVCILAAGALFGMAFKLRRERRRFDSLADSAFDYRLVWDEDLSHINFGEDLKKLLESCGVKPDADYVRSVFGNKSTGESAGISLCVNALKKNGVVSRYVTPAGKEGYIRWKSISADGKIYSFGSDVGDSMTGVGSEIVSEFDYMRTAVANAEAGPFAIITEGESARIETNASMCEILGFSDKENIPLEKFYSIVKTSELLEVQRKINCFITGVTDSLYVEVSLKTSSGTYHIFTIECRLNKGATDFRRLRTGMIFDTTANRIHREAAFDSGNIDAVTGIYTRSGFMSKGEDFLEQCRKKGTSAVLVCLQVVRLRKISMLFGIEVSDDLLKLYAETMLRLTDEKAVLGKMGFSDYAMLLECSDKAEVEKLLKSIDIMIENCCNNETLPSVLKEQVGFTAGACFFDGADDIGTLYNKASVTLFSGSESQGDLCRYFDAEVEKKVSGRDIVEHEIGEALRQGELELYYQPKIDIKTGEMVGAEALMRWNHKTQGLIMPGQFISVAEEMGIITKIDEWGMLQACIQSRMWREKGYPDIRISVNMSQAQLYQTDVVESVKNALEESGIPASCLEVELTETMAIIDIDRTVSVLNALKKLGVSISMDDFGTGYSSLSSLKILPIDVLKIDRSLVYDIETNETARCIAKAIIEMGKALKLTVLAEGVETEEQRAILEELGCDIAQGFLYSKPKPAALIEREFLIPEAGRTAAKA